MRKVVSLLCSKGFKRFHNGSLARLPEGKVLPEGNFHVRVAFPISPLPEDVEAYYDQSSHESRYYAKPYVLTVMPRGMFKSSDGDLAFVLCNPWVGPNPFLEQDRISYTFVFDPAHYRGFDSEYRLRVTESDGTTRDLGIKMGKSVFDGVAEPGEIRYWTMERL